MIRSTLTVLWLFITGLTAIAQDNPYWINVKGDNTAEGAFTLAGSNRPSRYQLFRLERSRISQVLRQAPLESAVPVSASGTLITLPDGNGILQSFRVVEAPVMAPELAAKYPGIHSYAGKGVSDPSATVRFDLSMHGLHATILYGSKSTVYIDQLYGDIYRVVRRIDMTDAPGTFNCLTEVNGVPVTGTGDAPANVTDGKLRTYRLAMISGAEFSLHFIPGGGLPTLADSIAAVLAAQNSHVTRANAIYERDMGLRMVLVANNDQIIYFNPTTDPIANPNSPSGAAMQTAIDTRIGSGNYDIGHTESKGSDNGNAGCIGCVCTAGLKGRGWTVYSNPSLLEFFVVDYLTHEMGHQFGANHTFSHNIEGTGVNVEPGSGVTIMGYAGIVPGQNVASHSIDIFSVKSIEQISNYILTGGGSGCDVETVTGNTAPTANAGADFIIPHSTPFTLTGTASDPDPGDLLRYNWEQIDSRISSFPSIPSSTATAGPMFRTYLDYSIPQRTFPDLQYILTGANGFTWEVLPSVGRNLNFRFIVKDNHTGGGATRSDDMVVTTDGASGPFTVTSPNAAVNWVAGFQQQVSWDVNNTQNAPVNCANVRILLSTDGGLSFPTVLAANTPNDGGEIVTLPCITTNTARIKVESIGNIFFDISNSNFSIAPGFDFNTPAQVVSGCPVPASLSTTLGTLTACGFSNNITLSASGNPPGTTVSFTPNPVAPGGNVTVTLNGTAALAPGTYTVTVSGNASGAPVKVRDISFVISATVTPVITSQPAAQTVCSGSNASFAVTATDASGYQWQVSTGGGPFTNISGATASSYTVTGATSAVNGNQYRVVVSSACATSVTSNAVTLTVINPVSIGTQPVNREICSGGNTSFSITAASTQTITYRWQVSTNGGGSWTDVVNGALYAGASTATLALNNTPVSANTNQYRCLVSNITCTAPVISGTATLTVRQLPSVILTAGPLTSLLPGQTTTLTASPSGSTGGTLSTAWFYNGNSIVNSGNTRVVNVEQVGTYRVGIQELFPGGLTCANQSADVVVEAAVSDKLFIFPSPNDGRFTVSYYNNGGNSTQRRIIITGAGGARVYDQIFPVSGPYTLLNIDLRKASRGIYFVTVGDAAGTKLAEGKVHIR